MKSSEDLHYTSDIVKTTQSPLDSCKHSQTKTILIASKRFPKFGRNRRLKKISRINESICTLVEHEGISQSLNNHNLKISLKGIYNRDPVSQLKKIFETRHKALPESYSHKSKNFSFESSSRKKSKVDSLFHHNEAEIIMNELKTIQSPKVWQQVVQNFKKKPSTLMDLIPIDSYYQKARTPSSSIKSPSNLHFFNRKSASPPDRIKYTKTLSITKKSNVDKSLKITRCGSESPIEVMTFLEECENEALTDDWSKSLLYQKLKSGESLELNLTESEMKSLSRKPPREKEMIERIMSKGLSVLRCLLMELLGTKEDMARFEEKFKNISNVYVRALMERCLCLMNVRNLTLDILRCIEKREKILKNLKVSQNRVKEKVIKVFCLGKEIRDKVMIWKQDESVPFPKFVFKGSDYLQKISEDSVVLQEYLTRVVDFKCKV